MDIGVSLHVEQIIELCIDSIGRGVGSMADQHDSVPFVGGGGMAVRQDFGDLFTILERVEQRMTYPNIFKEGEHHFGFVPQGFCLDSVDHMSRLDENLRIPFGGQF